MNSWTAQGNRNNVAQALAPVFHAAGVYGAAQGIPAGGRGAAQGIPAGGYSAAQVASAAGGYSAAQGAYAQETVAYPKLELLGGKLSIPAIIWCALGFVANIAMAVVFLVATQEYWNRLPNKAMVVCAIVTGFACAFANLAILCGKKWGFYALCALAALGVVFAVGAGNWAQVPLAILNPGVMWLFLMGSWGGWEEIDAQNRQRREDYRRQLLEIQLRHPEIRFKNRSTALGLMWLSLLGLFGIHRFYLGKVVSGILFFCTVGGCLVWLVVDIVLLARGDMTDSKGRPLM
ncbi:MAG: TM2 domain-containing protein [Lachnospiraceae bacterium]|nr:TM2 domain-containing protein [Lachnospiraceae bacterium]